MKTVHAIYENGVFRPTGKVELPEHCEVAFEPRVLETPSDPDHSERVRSMLKARFRTGQTDLAEGHDEHQP